MPLVRMLNGPSSFTVFGADPLPAFAFFGLGDLLTRDPFASLFKTCGEFDRAIERLLLVRLAASLVIVFGAIGESFCMAEPEYWTRTSSALLLNQIPGMGDSHDIQCSRQGNSLIAPDRNLRTEAPSQVHLSCGALDTDCVHIDRPCIDWLLDATVSVVWVIAYHTLRQASWEAPVRSHVGTVPPDIVHWHCGSAAAQSRTGARSMAASKVVDKS